MATEVALVFYTHLSLIIWPILLLVIKSLHCEKWLNLWQNVHPFHFSGVIFSLNWPNSETYENRISYWRSETGPFPDPSCTLPLPFPNPTRPSWILPGPSRTLLDPIRHFSGPAGLPWDKFDGWLAGQLDKAQLAWSSAELNTFKITRFAHSQKQNNCIIYWN